MGIYCGAKKLREIVRILERKLGVFDEIKSSCCGVTLAQCHAIVEIGRAESLSLNDLANILGLDKSTVSRTVSGMILGKLITQEINPEDRRHVIIQLTERGSRIYRKIEESMDKYFKEVFNAIPKKKREQVLESLELFVKALAENEDSKKERSILSGQ